MKKIVLAIAAAGSVLVGGAAVANAQTALTNGDRGAGQYDAWQGDRDYSTNARAEAIGTPRGYVTVRERVNGEVVVRRVPRY
jgi:hypothetical protein